MNRSCLLVILVALVLIVGLVSPAFAYAKKPSPAAVVKGAEKLPLEAYRPLIEQVVSEADAYFEGQGRYVDPSLYGIDGPTRVILAVRSDIPAVDVAKHMLFCRVTPSLGDFYLAIGVVTPDGLEDLLSVEGVVMALRDVNLGEEMGITFDMTPEEFKEHILWPGKDVNLPPKPDNYETMSSDLKPEPNMWNALWEGDVYGAHYYANGSGVTIAIVDTGVDFGTFALSFPDYIARDSSGVPASFDADALGLVITNTTVTAFENATGVYIATEGTDPYVYLGYIGVLMFDTPNIPFSWLFGTTMPWDMEVTGILEDGEACQFGFLLQIIYMWGWLYVVPFPVIVVDTDGNGVYDNVYVDLSWWWAPDLSFSNDPAVNYTDPIAAMDITGDGVNDWSCGSLGYFLDIWGACPNKDERWGVLEPIDDEGNYTCIIYDYYGHGTSCASCAAGKYGWLTVDVHPYVGFGVAPEADLMGVVSLWLGDVIEGLLWAAGFDLVPGTEGWTEVPGYGTVWGEWVYTGEHKADVISNSWGASEWASYAAMGRLYWYDVLAILEDCLMVPGLLDPDYPGTVVVHALGNGGPGYGTATEPGFGFLPISVGASTDMWFSYWMYGYGGGLYDEVMTWSARGPTPMGVVEPDVVAVGAYDTAAVPVWWASIWGFDGTEAWDMFGGTSMATPITAGVAALVIQAYRIAHGEDPTPEMVKLIIKSTADDLGYDPFVQGAGRISAYRAVLLALGMAEGGSLIISSTSSWENLKSLVSPAWLAANNYLPSQIPEVMPESWSDAGWFAGVLRPGESASTTFTLTNLNDTYDMEVELSAVEFEMIDSFSLTETTWGVYPADWGAYYTWGYMTIMTEDLVPDDAELMVVYLNMSYEDFEWYGPLWLYVGVWFDYNGDGFINKDEVWRVSFCANDGTTQEVRVGPAGMSYFYTDSVLRERHDDGVWRGLAVLRGHGGRGEFRVVQRDVHGS